MNTKHKEYRWVLILLIIGLGFVLGTQLWTYVTGFLGALTVYVVMRNFNKKLIEKKKLKPWLSALIIILIAVVIIFIPLIGLVFILINTISNITLDIPELTRQAQEIISMINDRLDVNLDMSNIILGLPAKMTGILEVLISNVYSIAINGIISAFVLYFMLVDYVEFEEMISDLLPFDKANKKILKQEIDAIMKAATIGIPLVSIIQGVIAYGGYLAFGVNNPGILAVLVGFTTIIPVVGTALVWIPIGLIPLLDGEIARGMGLLAYGLLVIGGSDTISRFLLQKRMANIHPLITFFGVFFGIPIFGLLGVIFGPLIISLFFLFINMYRSVYVVGSNATKRISTIPEKKTEEKMNSAEEVVDEILPD